MASQSNGSKASGAAQQLHAVVLSGSGADAAYQVGVLKALCSGRSPATARQPVDPRVFAGTSTGAYNASVLVSRWGEHGASAIDQLEEIWRDRLAWKRFVNGSFRLRLNPLELLDSAAYTMGRSFGLRRLWGDVRHLTGAVWNRANELAASSESALKWLADNVDTSLLVETEPFRETIDDTIDFAKVHGSDRRLTIATMDWETGKVCHFVNRSGPGSVGPAAVRAASAILGIHGPELVDGHRHVDSESQMIAPLKPALDELDALARSQPEDHDCHLHVIYISADPVEMSTGALNSTLQTLYGSQVINWTSRIEQDLQRVRDINQGIVMIEDLAALDEHDEGLADGETEAIRRMRGRVGQLPAREAKGLQTAARQILRRERARGEWKKLTVHRYFPAQGLDGNLGFVDFRRSRIASLIEQGVADTVEHDCERNGCVRIEPGEPSRSLAATVVAARERTESRHALIFSGGGAYGAYQVGVAKALFDGESPASERQPLDPEVFAGTSIGAFNASFLVSKWQGGGPRAIASLEQAWLEHMTWKQGTNGAFRVRLNPLEGLFPKERSDANSFLPLRRWGSDMRYLLEQIEARGGDLLRSDASFLERLAGCFDLSVFVTAEPWERTIADLIDFERIRKSSRRLTIAATSWERGRVLHFGNQDVSMEAIRASSAVPGFYAPANVHDQTCVDGAVLMNTPLKPALDELRDLASGGEESDFVLHVVYMSGKIDKSSAPQGTLQALFRSQAIHWGSAVEQDIENARTLNQGLAMFIDALVGLGKTAGTKLSDEEVSAIHNLVDTRSVAEAKILLETSDKILHRREMGRPYKQLTIHRYFPRIDLGGVIGFVDLSRSTLEQLIAQGFADATEHDCQANGCVRVDARPPA